MSLEAGGGILCRPNPAATLLVLAANSSRSFSVVGDAADYSYMTERG